MTFEDVAVHFTEGEWSLLDERQRSLHQEVMEENVAGLISLGESCLSAPLVHKANLADRNKNISALCTNIFSAFSLLHKMYIYLGSFPD